MDKSDWYTDSGVSYYLMPNGHWGKVANYQEKDICMANNIKVSVTCCSKVTIFTKTKRRDYEILCKYVLCVPELTTSFF